MTNRAANRFARLAAAFAAGALAIGSIAPAQAVGGDPKGDPKTSASTNGDMQRSTVSPQDDKNRYCVKQATTGTIIDRKVCKSRVEWIKSTGIDPVTIAR